MFSLWAIVQSISNVPALANLLADSELAVAKSAADALRKIGTPEALRAVEAYEQRENK